jgi:tetratricopeptide (TPR) repeat protein/tRNA A-37 threonylcarbamoyl transferase component Bud32
VELLGGRYRIVSLLGAGGMGEVFLAHDTLLERRVAVKLLPADIQSDSVARERLRREALAAAALDHPFICKIHEIGHADGRLFVVMEFVEGETLHVLARRALLPMRQVVEMANELAEALEEAHRRGFVHRDLKPANVMITLQGHVKVMDFGLAKPFAPDASAGVGSDAATMLTASGVRVGTPAYMSPEQILGGALDPRSDIFSLGVILHEVATGRHPFLRDDPAQTMAAILRDPPASGSRDVESLSGFGAVVGRMLAKACAERYQTARELRTELEALRDLAWASTSSRAVASASARQAERTPLVGRETETGELKRLLARMLTGQGGFALVGGEPGVGKTRLARELMEQARQRGCLCLTGRCYEMEGAPPFVPFIEMTEQAVHIVPQAVREAMGDIAPEISTIVPSLRRTYSDIAPVPEVPPEQRRRLVFSAYVEYMQRASQKSPMVVLFDDLHWADEPTLQLLQHVAPHLASMRLLVVGTYRDVELDVKRPFAKTLEELFRQRLATRISLRRLSESGVQQMLSAMSGSAPPSGLAKAVFRETEGNPFFVEEVYQHLAEEGKLFDDSGAWKADLRVDTIEVPEGVRLVIGRRLERLGEHARKVLTAAGVIGRTFPIDVLQAIVDVSEDEVLDALDEAERAQLVASEPGHRTPRYEFVHELIRTTLASGLSIPRRQRLHLKIADALERLRTASLESHASVLAHHLYQAGAAADVQRTARFLMLAGRRAIAAGAFEETLETFDRLIGLELADNEPLLAEAFEHRGAALVGLRRPDEAVAALDRALKLHTARGDDAGIARAAKACHFCFVLLTRLSEMTAVLNRGLHALSDRAVAERAGLQAMLGVCFLLTGFDEAERNLEEAMATAERLADPALIGHVLMFKAVVQDNSLDLGAALDTGRRALPLLRSEALWERSDLVFHLAAAAYRLGRFEELDTLLPLLKETAGRAGHLGALWNHEHFLHRRELMLTGDLRAFLPYAERALRGTAQFLPYIGGARWSPAVMRLYLGQAEEALEQLTALVFDQPIVQAKSLAQTVLFAATALADRADRARTLFPEGVSWLPALGRRNLSSVWVALEASVTGLALVGDKERCGALYPSTLAYIDTGLVCGSEVVGPGNPQLAAALAADAAGHADQARGHFEIALRQARELPFRILQPTVLYWYGRALSSAPDAGDQARGRAMVEAALTDFRGLEMVLHANLAERFLRS